MAAHLEGKGSSVLDFMGFAQKFGPVLSYIRIAPRPIDIHQVRIEPTRADALIGCDLVVSSSPKASTTYNKDHTQAVVNSAEMMTGDFVRHRDANLRADDRVSAIRNAVGDDNLSTIDANGLAQQLMGDTIYANVLLLGYAWQKGLVPVSLKALMRAIVLNNVAIENNKRAFLCGRIAAAEPEKLGELTNPDNKIDETLDAMIARRRDFLVEYQDQALADRYEHLLKRVRETESGLAESDELTRAVAKSYFKLLSYKDEYEVARLHTRKEFLDSVRKEFGSKAKLRYHLAPPLLNTGMDARGRPRKKEFGGWMLHVFRLMAPLRVLRGTMFDVLGLSAERRMERELIGEFERLIDDLLPALRENRLREATELVALYMNIRGYGPVKEEAAKVVRQQVADKMQNLVSVSAEAA